MVVREFYRTRNDGVNLYKTYSDEGFLIQKLGTEEKYTTAIDVETSAYVYIETAEKPKEKPERPIRQRPIKEEVANETN